MRMLKLLWRCSSDCFGLRKYHLAAAVQQQTSAGFFLRIPIHKNITHTNRNFSCNSDLKIVMKRGTISWKGDQLVQHAFLQQCPHVSAMIKGDLSSLLASSLQCFASRWTLGYIWKIRGHYMPLWKRSTPKNWHLTKHHVGKWWIPLQKLTWQRKITIFCVNEIHLPTVNMSVVMLVFRGCFTDGKFSVMKSQWLSLPGHWRKWSHKSTT